MTQRDTSAQNTLSLLREIRGLMAGEEKVQARLDKFVDVIAAKMDVDVSSIYLQRRGGRLELCATRGLDKAAVHTTLLNSGEGLVGQVAYTARSLNLADAAGHPMFAYKPETGEDKFASFLGVPMLRGGRTLGVLVVQSVDARIYTEDEVEALQTVAMILAEIAIEDERAADKAGKLRGIRLSLDSPENYSGKAFSAGLVYGKAHLHVPPMLAGALIAEDPDAEETRIEEAIASLRADVDLLVSGDAANLSRASKEIFESYRMFAYDRKWVDRLREAVHSGLTAEAATERVRNEHRARLQKARDPYLRARLHDLEDLANRMLRILSGEKSGGAKIAMPENAVLLAGFKLRMGARGELEKAFEALKGKPAATKDGQALSLQLNAGLRVDLPQIDRAGADGIGLFRTEFQFMVSEFMPRLEAQTELYREAIMAAGDRPVTFRTLDLGGDKILPYSDPVPEENPALGWRSIRIALDRPGLMRYQLRALITAGAGRHLRVMFPMVATVDEFIAAKALFNKEVQRASRAGAELPLKIEVGVMMETPALAWSVNAICDHADFVSVGANDLMQFFFAADRDNARVSDRYDVLHPAAMSIMRFIAQGCERHNVPISVCGEMAGRPLEAMCLIALGYNNLSMSSTGIGPVKAAAMHLDAAKLREFLDPLISIHSRLNTVREHVKEWCEKEGVPI